MFGHFVLTVQSCSFVANEPNTCSLIKHDVTSKGPIVLLSHFCSTIQSLSGNYNDSIHLSPNEVAADVFFIFLACQG